LNCAFALTPAETVNDGAAMAADDEPRIARVVINALVFTTVSCCSEAFALRAGDNAARVPSPKSP
jgi:hypothetical protein